jgi:hypothetical protein
VTQLHDIYDDDAIFITLKIMKKVENGVGR